MIDYIFFRKYPEKDLHIEEFLRNKNFLYHKNILKIIEDSSIPQTVNHSNSSKTAKDRQNYRCFLSLSSNPTKCFLDIYHLTFTRSTNIPTPISYKNPNQTKISFYAKNFSLFFPKAYYSSSLPDTTFPKISIFTKNKTTFLSAILPTRNEKKINSFRNILREIEQSG